METFLHAFTPLVARLFLSAIFVASGVHKLTDWSGTAQGMEAQGMVAVPFFLAGAIVLELGGGLMVLLGFKARLGAILLIVFLIPTTLIFHNFWAYAGETRQTEMIHFMKNCAIFGGLSMVLAFGPGMVSIDARSARAAEVPSNAHAGKGAHPAPS